MKFEIDINDEAAMEIVKQSMTLTIECASKRPKDPDANAVILAAKIIRDWYSVPR